MAQNTKQKLVKTAQSLLWTKGYDGASLNDIVKKAGLSKGAFFHYYPNKQAITTDILDLYARQQWFEPLDTHMQNAASVKAGLFEWLQDNYNSFSKLKFRGGCLLGNLALGMADRDRKIREHIKTLFLQWENQFVTYLKPAYEKKQLLMEPRQMARLIIATYQGALMTAKVHKDKNRASREFQALGEMIERLMKG
jgi:TetR/AcrR family transcriptional repressor of nem operon